MAQTSSRSGRLCLVAPASRPAPRDAKRVRPSAAAGTGCTRPQVRPIPAWSWMLAAVAAVAVTALVVTIGLLAIADHANPGTDQANARLDVVRTGLRLVPGPVLRSASCSHSGATHHEEITPAQTDHDATERRITELYTKAVEQLGNDEARRSGSAACSPSNAFPKTMRRSARPSSNVICACCAMPFPAAAGCRCAVAERHREREWSHTGTMANPEADDDAWQQEKRVRLTAQRILSDHLRKPTDVTGGGPAFPPHGFGIK